MRRAARPQRAAAAQPLCAACRASTPSVSSQLRLSQLRAARARAWRTWRCGWTGTLELRGARHCSGLCGGLSGWVGADGVPSAPKPSATLVINRRQAHSATAQDCPWRQHWQCRHGILKLAVGSYPRVQGTVCKGQHLAIIRSRSASRSLWPQCSRRRLRL